MARRKRRKFADALKADAVRLCVQGGRSIGQVAADLDLTETALRGWVKLAEADAGTTSPDTLATAERQELQQLRRDLQRRPKTEPPVGAVVIQKRRALSALLAAGS